MPRKPYFRNFDGWWYAQIRVGRQRKQVKLIKGKENEKEAYRLFCRLMADEGGQIPEPTRFDVAALCDLFLDYSQKHNEPATYEWYRSFLQDFCDHYGRLVVADLKPFHMTRWLDAHPGWNDGGRRCAITSVKRAFNWACDEGLLRENPFRKVRKPKVKSRDRILTPAERSEVVTTAKGQAFLDFVFALQETGCRPGEIAMVTAENVNLETGVWVLPKHKTVRKTGKPRVVYLTPAMVELCRRLIENYPTGPLFRNRLGKPWTPNAIRCRFRRLRQKLPHLKDVVSYTYRHSFVTDALEKGVGVVEVAELIGDKGTDMVMKHYQHLNQRREHLRQAAVKATQPRAS
jgi:integrase